MVSRAPSVLRLALAVAVVLPPGAVAAQRGGPPQALGAPVVVLPPGLWFRSGHYEDWALESEPDTPQVAVIAGVYDTDGRAARAARGATGADLAPGYPWLVSASDLRLVDRCDGSIVVVTGLFRSGREAERWVDGSVARSGHSIVPLARDGESACPSAGVGRLEITHVEPEVALVSAWTPDVLASLESALGRMVSPADLADADAAPRCRVAGGSVFSFDASRDDVAGFGRRWAPVRCGEDIAFAPVEQTRSGTVFEARDDGSTFVHQITAVSCDVAHFDTWAWRPGRGRAQLPEHPPTFVASCGGE